MESQSDKAHETRRDETRRDKTRRDKTRQDGPGGYKEVFREQSLVLN